MRALRIGGAIAALAVSSAAAGQTLDAGVDVLLSGEVVGNPYLERGDTEATGTTGAVNAEVRPWLRQRTALTSFDLSGFVQAREFADGQELEDNYGATAGISHRASERVTLTARAAVHSTASRWRAAFPGLDPNPTTPVPDPLPLEPELGVDPTLLGARGRTTTVSGAIGTQYAIDARRSLQIDLDVQDSSFSHANARDYRTHGIAAALTQIVDPATSVGATLSIRQTDYDSSAVADARIVTAMGLLTRRLDPRWTLDASAGASLTRIDAAGPFPSRQSTSLAAAATLCRREERGSLCLDYRRQPEPTGLGQVRNTDSAGLSYNRQWAERNRVTVDASYSRSGGAFGPGASVPAVEYLTVRATLERAFGKRVSGFLSASTSRVYSSGVDVEPNFNVGLGIHLRLGRRT